MCVCVCVWGCGGVGVLTEAILAALLRVPPAQVGTGDALMAPEVVVVASHGGAISCCRAPHRISLFLIFWHVLLHHSYSEACSRFDCVCICPPVHMQVCCLFVYLCVYTSQISYTGNLRSHRCTCMCVCVRVHVCLDLCVLAGVVCV